MVKTAEEKAWKRYAEQLEQGIEPRPLSNTNRAILAEVRAEVRGGCKTIQDAAYRATKRVKTAGDESVQRVQEAESQAISRITALSSGSLPAQQEQLVDDTEEQRSRAAELHTLEGKDPDEFALALLPQEAAKRSPWDLLPEAQWQRHQAIN